MTEEEWLTTEDQIAMLDFLRGKMTIRKERLFGVACYRQIFHLLSEEEAGIYIDMLERLADDPSPHGQWGFGAPETLTGEEMAAIACLKATAAEANACNQAIQSALIGAPIPLVIPERVHQPPLLRCVFGNPFRPITVLPEWRTETAIALARQMYESRDFSAMPILADALEDANCTDEAILTHCRQPAEHVRGCHVVDACLGKS